MRTGILVINKEPFGPLPWDQAAKEFKTAVGDVELWDSSFGILRRKADRTTKPQSFKKAK